MTYCTLDDLCNRFGEAELVQLTDRDQGKTIDAEVLDASIKDADDLIDSWLASGGYSTPLKQVPRAINRAACDIVRYYLWEVGTSEEVNTRYKDAIVYLTNLSTGKALLSLGDDDQSGSQLVPTGLSDVRAGESNTNWDNY